MTWLDHHKVSERLASKAEMSVRRGQLSDARRLYMEAGDAEEQALQHVREDKPRTFSVTAVSAVALFYKADDLPKAKSLAYTCLGTGRLQPFASQQIGELLESIWERQAGIGLAPRDAHMLVSAKGGEIETGGAPLDLVLLKARQVKTLLFRTVEHMKELPLRKRGSPSRKLQAAFQPWMYQAPASSYQFAVAIRPPRQLSMLDEEAFEPHHVVENLFHILDACVTSPDKELPRIVPEEDYAGTFIKLTRDLAPTATSDFTSLDIRAGSDDYGVTLVRNSRDRLGSVLSELQREPDSEKEKIRGVLRALHLDKDWIEVVPEGGSALKIDKAGDEVDDRIGPLVNNLVVVTVARKGEKRHYIDMESAE